MAAQNQHYVPKFILRQFLSDEQKERVTVYDKHQDKSFVTSIRNVMAERRFNDFVFEDEWFATFEPIASGAENMVLPAYRRVLEERRLAQEPEQKAALAFLLAFQFLRTKAHRDRWQHLEDGLQARIEAMGGRMQDLKGWEEWQPNDEDHLKRSHILNIQHCIGDFTRIMATKDFFLAEAAPGRSFYLGDNPVSLHNERDLKPYGNLGLAVPGIEIYLPLSADLLLGAWCPSIVRELRSQLHLLRERKTQMLAMVMAGKLSPKVMRETLQAMQPHEDDTKGLVEAVEAGRPLDQNADNMDFYNSLQTQFASRYVVCQKADFALASRYNLEFPKFRSGVQSQMN
jgi:hypothetical protein